MRIAPKFSRLTAIAFVVAAAAATAPAAAQDAQSDADLKAVESFRLTMPVLNRMAQVQENMYATVKAHPELVKKYAGKQDDDEDAKSIEPPGFGAADGQRRYVIFFKEEDVPAAEAAERINAWEHPGELAVAMGRAVHLWLAHPTHEAKFFGSLKKAIGPGTNRDLKVVTTLAERWGA